MAKAKYEVKVEKGAPLAKKLPKDLRGTHSNYAKLRLAVKRWLRRMGDYIPAVDTGRSPRMGINGISIRRV